MELKYKNIQNEYKITQLKNIELKNKNIELENKRIELENKQIELKNKQIELEKRKNELTERLKKYTFPLRNKKYYEATKEKLPKCISCNLFPYHKKENSLCSYCDPNNTKIMD
jgi:hypothetical protein